MVSPVAGPIQIAGLVGSHPGLGIQLLPKIVLSSTLGSTLCSIHPILKMVPQFHKQASSLDERTWAPLCVGREI